MAAQVDEVDVVDDDVGVVLLAPLLAEGAVEPGVVGGDEVAPLQNLESFLLGSGALREEECGRGARSDGGGAGAGDFNEVAAREAILF